MSSEGGPRRRRETDPMFYGAIIIVAGIVSIAAITITALIVGAN